MEKDKNMTEIESETLNISADNFFIDGQSITESMTDVKNGGFSLGRPKVYSWQPKEDISTFEVAKCLPIVIAMQMVGNTDHRWKETIENLPTDCQRHFEIVE